MLKQMSNVYLYSVQRVKLIYSFWLWIFKGSLTLKGTESLEHPAKASSSPFKSVFTPQLSSLQPLKPEP